MAEQRRAPWACRDYNKNGCTRSNCSHPHVCSKSVEPGSFCNEGKKCKLNHDIFDPQVKRCLVKSGFDVNVRPGELRRIYFDALKVRKASLPPKGTRPEPLASHASPGQNQGIADEIQRLTALLNVRNVPRVCLNFNQRQCSNRPCDLIHMCHSHVQGICKNSFKLCPFSHDILQPRVKQILSLAGFNVNQAPKNLLEDYRQALQMPSGTALGNARPRQREPIQQGRGRPPYSGKLAKTGTNANISKSYVDLRGESVQNPVKRVVNRRGSSGIRTAKSTSGSGTDSDSDSLIGSSDSEENQEGMSKTPTQTTKKARQRRGGKKKQKAQALTVSQSKSTEHVDKDKGAIQKKKTSSGSQPEICKPSSLHVSLLDDATICVDFLKGLCKHENCLSHHQDMPYLWQYKILQNGWKWKTFNKDNGQLLEQSFCSVSTASCSLMLEGQMFNVDFDQMAASSPEMNLPVRRLTSASYVDNTVRQSFLTQWRWYWESDEGWTECGRKVKDVKSSLNGTSTQIKLETAYQGDHTSGSIIKMENHKYKVDFSKMLQKNMESGTERRLRRRPIYLSPEDKAKVLRFVQKISGNSITRCFRPCVCFTGLHPSGKRLYGAGKRHFIM